MHRVEELRRSVTPAEIGETMSILAAGSQDGMRDAP
jgi:hypothetical protein